MLQHQKQKVCGLRACVHTRTVLEIRCISNKNYDLSSVIVLDSLLSLFE